MFQRGSAAGVAVDEYSIIGLPAFYRATQILGGVVASIPFDVIEKLDNGGTRIATEHPNYKIVSREPCELYTSHTFYKTMVLHYLAHGAFYAVINRNSLTNRVNNLHILNPTKMEIGYNSSGAEWLINGYADTVEDTSMGDSYRSFKTTLKGWSGSVDVFWDETDTTGQGGLVVGAQVTISVFPEGASSGVSEKYYTGTATVTGKTITGSFDGMVESTITLQGTGALTQETLA